MTDEKTPDGTQERPEGGSATPAPPEGSNGPQAGADGLQGEQQPRGPVDWARQQAAERESQAAASSLRQQITAAIRDTPARYPDDIATAVWRVVQAELQQQRDRQAEQAADLIRRYADLRITLDEVLRQFVHKGHPGQSCLSSGWISEKTVARWRAALHPPQPAHNAGPSIRECVDADRRWWGGEKIGE